ncbi:MAG: M48 family metallopeptidase [Planctomycetota bacterium]
MATDFFDRQAAARRSTGWLLAMFSLAVLLTVVAVFLLAYSVTSSQQGVTTPPAWQLPAGVSAATLALILGGSLYKIAALRVAGGRGVAESLGGRRILHDTATDPAERRLLNVVDEMAIASGTPSPPVFLLEDGAINAFAAGYSPSDAVVGVTRGCIENLSRDELQGVIAHEFSHILNGDMRMSIRLIGVLHGILLLGLVGQLVLRTVFGSGAHYGSRQSGSDDSGKGGSAIIAILAIGAALIVIGSIGSFMGGMIKAAVSRQREYLADASAVQFTRNPQGIAGALKRLLANAEGSRLKHPRAAELSHMYFAQGVWEGFTSLMATHPPLPKRIRSVEPNWDGSLPNPTAESSASSSSVVSAFAGSNTVPVELVDTAVDRIGEPEDVHRRYAAELIEQLPQVVRSAAGSPDQARAVVYGLLLDPDDEIRRRQRDSLEEMADPAVVRFLFDRIVPVIDDIDPRLRLPLIDLSLPSLSAMSFPQYQRFCRSFRALVEADEKVDLFEWVLSQILLRHLQPQFERVRSPRVKYRSLDPLRDDCAVLLSAVAWKCGDHGKAEAGYGAGRRTLGVSLPILVEQSKASLHQLRICLDRLASTEARLRGRIVDAAAAVICEDGHVDVAEAELLRGVADLLDCPMPPLLPGQAVG